MTPKGIEWIVVIWYYATQVVGPILAFVMIVALVILALRINGRLKRLGYQAATPNSSSEEPAAPSEEAAKAAERKLESARLELDLADAGLTRRERTVLLAACEGRTFASLAEDMGVSRSTVGTYCNRAYEKIGAASREEAMAWLSDRRFAHRLVDAGLTEGEVEGALLAASGATTADIAQKLVLSESAVNSRLQQAYGKLGVHGRADLAKMKEAGSC